MSANIILPDADALASLAWEVANRSCELTQLLLAWSGAGQEVPCPLAVPLLKSLGLCLSELKAIEEAVAAAGPIG